MCGIAGQVTFGQLTVPPPPLRLLNHRGPDGQGEWTNRQETVYFGHTRLAILEPTPAGQQPMQDASGRFTVTFNGEIYNHLSLRSGLSGVRWRGTSDTETLVELLATKGLAALRLLKGMFAFALHDATDDSVLLVRDRLGIKPLWFRTDSATVSFSSEVRALLHSDDEFSFTRQALSEYIGFGHLPGGGQLTKEIEAVLPGHWVNIQREGNLTSGTWWPDDHFASPSFRNRSDCVQRVNHLVTTAIEEHLISDVGVGAFLSGGIDSSIVALVAGKALGRKLQTFTVGFPEQAFDERSIARRVAMQAGSEHHEVEISQESCLDWVKQAVLSLDLPSVDAINTFIVSKAVQNEGLKVALSGLGGDELFGGYSSFSYVPLLRFLNSLPQALSRRLVGLMPQRLRNKLSGLTDFGPLSVAVATRRFTTVASLRAMNLDAGIPFIPPAPRGLDTMGLISWAELQGYMMPMLLRDSDQMSMAVGLEIRVPFLDHQLVEEVLTMPQRYKKGQGVKPLLVDAFRSRLPTEVFNRPKQGFALPMDEWIRGPLAEFTKEGVQAAADLLALSEPLRQQADFQQGLLHWTRVWHWCVLGHWLVERRVASVY